MKRIKLVVVAAGLSVGCYTYVPAEIDQVPLQTEVTAVLSTAGEIDLRDRVGIPGGRLQGELVERTSDQLMIAVPTTGPFTGSTGERLVQRIDISRSDVLFVQVKEPSTPKTVGLLVGAAAAVTAAAIMTYTAERNPGSETIEPPPPDERVGPSLPFLLRIH